jgi:hypothetical protein
MGYRSDAGEIQSIGAETGASQDGRKLGKK